MKCPRCEQEKPPKAKFCLECGTPFKRRDQGVPPVASYTDLQDALTVAQAQATEALEQQTATSEILRVISSSPTDVQPVFDTIVKSAVRLCDGLFSSFFRFDGELIHPVAQHNHSPEALEILRRTFPMRPGRGLPIGRAILDCAVAHVPDVERDPEYRHLDLAHALGWRSALAVPLLREGSPIGGIFVARAEAGPFSDRQIELLRTFADQAVIAIENVRLFTELQQRNEAVTRAHAQVTEALEQQTATAEILQVISRSPTDVQPVFDTIAESAVRLCDGLLCGVYRFDGKLIHFVAHHNWTEEALETVHSVYPRPPSRETQVSTAILDRTVVEVRDFEDDPGIPAPSLPLARALGYRSILVVPMLREGSPIGAVAVARAEAGPFTGNQIALLKTFADQAVIAIENVRLFTELQASNRELTTALDTQTATSDILRVISRSQTDVRPVFDAILESAVRLLRANTGVLTRITGDQIDLAAFTSSDDAGVAAARATYPQSLRSEWPHAQAIRNRAPFNIADTETDPRLPEATQAYARARGWRSGAIVPMLRHAEAIGTLGLSRGEPGGFTDDEIALLKTFTDQAVIAIENVRLFTELEFKNADLTEALEQQTATSEILGVISRSPTEVGPVLAAVAESAARLCTAVDAIILSTEGAMMRRVAHVGNIASVSDVRSVTRDTPSGRAIVERQTIHIEDILEEFARGEYLEARALQEGSGFRTVLVVPLMREGAVIGVINIRRLEVRAFTAKQIALVKTFADQAVIAIENVRLFTELQASNRELTTALDTQTATSDILRVISRSRMDLQPVFDAIVESAVRLLRGNASTLTRPAGDQIELAAFTSTNDVGDTVHRARFPLPLHSDEDHGQVMRNRAPFNSADAHRDPRLPETQHASARVRGYRSVVVVPLLRHDEAVGTLGVSRGEAGGFTDDEIALLQTFAAQAVIAIENARLLTELQARTQELTRSVEQLTALGDVGRAVSSSLDLDTVLTTIVSRAVQLSGTDGGTIFEYDEGTEEFSPRATLNADESQSAMLRATRLRRGEGAVGQMAVTREPTQIPDISAKGAYESRLRGALLEAGTRAVLAIPLLHEERIVGGLVVTRRTPGAFTPEIVEILKTFATQSALAIQNARLFHEIERKSRQLETASQHKSEFLANMSHELRTPLNAVIGFSEVLVERMFGELNEKQDEYVRDIYASGSHLLSLINDILDLSKIEAGRMELELAGFDLPQAIDNAVVLVRERALRRGITLEQSIDPRLGEIQGDERKIKQVLLNLLSNAIKFTPEGGRVGLRAEPVDEHVEVAVSDTGVGIAPEDHEAVFEEFRQVGAAEKKAEGTGLGLALARKFIELHGGRVSVRSQVGAGSTFTFTLPVRRGE
jgi:GAF domain-containing protein/anti-sigma regulatory factor (Ser/Thr protein kinase)